MKRALPLLALAPDALSNADFVRSGALLDAVGSSGPNFLPNVAPCSGEKGKPLLEPMEVLEGRNSSSDSLESRR